MKRTLERGSSTASLFSGGGVGEVLCVCMRERERENGCEEITRKRRFHCQPVLGLYVLMCLSVNLCLSVSNFMCVRMGVI